MNLNYFLNIKIEIVIAMRNEGATYKEIADAMGVKCRRVKYILTTKSS